MTYSQGTTIRRRILATSLFALVSAVVPGAALVQDVRADKKKKKKIPSVAERTDNQRIICETGGGKMAVMDGPDGGNTTECKGGSEDGYSCFNTKKTTKCDFLDSSPPPPVNNVGGPPSGGVNEQPSDGKPVGGGAGAGPTGGVEDPGGPIAQPDGPLLYKAGYSDRPRHNRKRNRRGKSRKT